jgi:sugar/nucleoside kinase (ribokinase family)
MSRPDGRYRFARIAAAAVIQFWRDQLDADSIDEAEWIHIGLLLPVRGLLRRLASAQSAIHRAVSEQCSPAFPSFPFWQAQPF